MDISKDLYQRITERHGTVLDLKKDPRILEDILREMRSLEHDDLADYQKKTASPFNVQWLDSWAAHWLLHQQSSSTGQSSNEFNSVLRQLVDLKLRDRLSELKKFIGRYAAPPDGGPPEPGTPPAGPQGFTFSSPTPPPDDFKSPTPPPDDFKSPTPPPDDFKSPTPPPDDFKSPTPPPDDFRRIRGGIFAEGPEPPDGGTPEPGVPNPPDPGPDSGILRENPWILYWFVSINAPLILDMIDAHITRRLNDLKMQHGT